MAGQARLERLDRLGNAVPLALLRRGARGALLLAEPLELGHTGQRGAALRLGRRELREEQGGGLV